MKSLTIDSIFPGFAFAEVDLPDPDNHDGSTGEHKCNFPGCKLAERGFKRYCDLIRHLSTHDPKAKKRGCPYPGSKCKIQADEKYQLTNWFEHIVTVHQGYVYSCDDCDIIIIYRKGTYRHHKETGHRCISTGRSAAQREMDLIRKNDCYRRACNELKLQKALGVESAWDDSWPESLPEYIKLMRKKARNNPQVSFNDPLVYLTSPLPPSSSLARHRFQPYIIPDASLAQYESKFVPYQMCQENNLAFATLHSSQLPHITDDQSNSAPFSHGDLAPKILTRDAFSSTLTPSSTPSSLDGLRLRNPTAPFTQNEADILYDRTIYNVSAFWKGDSLGLSSFTPQQFPQLPPSDANTPSISFGTPSTASPCSDFILTPPDLPRDAFTYEDGGCVDPRQLYFTA